MENLSKRKNHRLKTFDYGNYGYYFVTICTKDKRNLLCSIVGNDDRVVPKLTSLGQIVAESFHNIEKLNENIFINKFVIMPNYIHGIIIIKNTESIEIKEKRFDFEITERRGRRSLQGLIRDFKSITTRKYKKLYNKEDSLWQKSFYDIVILEQKEYDKIWLYIENNPMKWKLDKYYNL